MIAILEDSQIRIDAFNDRFPGSFITNDPDEFVLFVSQHADELKAVFFDHDLEFFVFAPYKQEITGFHAARVIVERINPEKTTVIVHSANVVGSQKIFDVFKSAGFNVHKLEFPKCLKVKVG